MAVDTKITADMIIHDVVKQYPQTLKVFQNHGLPCSACHVGSRESVAGGARTHRLDVEALLADLNRSANGEAVVVEAKRAPTGRGIPLPMAGDTGGKIKHIIAVMSGKGGVGKSLVTGLLAVSLQRQGFKVGIEDGDITGPSIAKMFGVKGSPSKGQAGIDPLRSRTGIKIMSMNMFLPNENDPVVWRGPMISSAIKQFYTDVDWGQLDYLLIDLPPGTSDAPMTVMQAIPVEGVIIVSSPQMLATMIVKKCISMVKTLKGQVVGVVENMAYMNLPNGERMEVFGPSNGPDLVYTTGSPLLAQVPIDPTISKFCDEGSIEAYDSEELNTLAANFIKAVKIKK
jgi:hybrid cluster-associated redox disulfide protein